LIFPPFSIIAPYHIVESDYSFFCEACFRNINMKYESLFMFRVNDSVSKVNNFNKEQIFLLILVKKHLQIEILSS